MPDPTMTVEQLRLAVARAEKRVASEFETDKALAFLVLSRLRTRLERALERRP